MLKTSDSAQSHPCVALGDLPGRLKTRYRRLALITSRHHLELLDGQDDDTLIVSCDWLLWQQELAAGRHIAYYELGIRDWDKPDTLATDLFLHANDWIPDREGGDPTVFRNVSLGRLFGAEMSMAMMNYYRLERALRKLFERFRPSEILFFDFTYDVNVLGVPLRKLVVETVSRDCGVAFVDRSGEAPPDDDHIAEAVYVEKGRGPMARAILATYAWLLEAATRMRCLASFRDRRVLVLVNSNVAPPLVRHFNGGGLMPVFLGRTIPRRAGLLWHCLRCGILLVAHRASRLSTEDLDRIDEIRRALEGAFSVPEDGVIGFARAYVRQEILDTGRMEEMAKKVSMAERLLDRIQPKRIVVDGIRNPPPRIYVELASARNIAVDYIWHSPLTPQNLKMDALGGEARYPRCVTRCLSWGRTNERWLDRVGATPKRIRVGSPIGDHYAGWQRRRSSNPGSADGKSVLLLQYTFVVTDLAGLNANMYENFVNSVRELKRLGAAQIRFKLHPGPGRWKKGYFQRIADYFGLDCAILKAEPFHECLAWADVVIGPALSGAMFETLAAGKPYHAFLLAPHSMDTAYFERFPLITGLDQLEASLARNSDTEGRVLLDNLYSIDEIPNPSERLWEVLRRDVACERERSR